jgi:NAD(P)-dependent dehydrogenase (short-subunit alcohol dehydrogenase family)
MSLTDTEHVNPGPKDIAVIVTGAARGMGRAMTLGLAAAGVRVAAADLPSSHNEMSEVLDTARERGLHDRIVPLDCDVTQWRDCAHAAKSVINRFGAVHGLINNAGVGMQGFGHVQVGTRARFYEHDVDAWRRAIDANFNGPFMMAKAVAPALVAQGWGRIVNIVTSHFTMVMDGFSPYGPTKAALEAATVIWAKDLAGTGVTVNALLPGGPGNTRMIPLAEVPDRSTLVQPEVMTTPICWLMSRASDGVTGRRFIAKAWDPGLPPAEAAAKAGAPAGWQVNAPKPF